jgi:hypothetical protein
MLRKLCVRRLLLVGALAGLLAVVGAAPAALAANGGGGPGKSPAALGR